MKDKEIEEKVEQANEGLNILGTSAIRAFLIFIAICGVMYLLGYIK